MMLPIWNNALCMVIAVIIDRILGDPPKAPHPIVYIGRYISFLEKNFRKIGKSNRILRIYGGVIVLVVCLTVAGVVYGILLLSSVHVYVTYLITIYIFYKAIAAKCLKDEAVKIYNILETGDIVKARKQLSYIVGRDTEQLEEKEIIRATVETVAENTSDGVIAPIFYGLLFGPIGAMVYKGINTMDSMLGYKTERYYYIGFFPAKVDDVVNYIPARLTGILIALCSPLVKGSIRESIKIMWRDRRNHKSPNCAYPEGAAAGALRIQLGGTNRYFNEVVVKPTIGDCVYPLCNKHIVRCNRLMLASEVLLIACVIVSLFIFIK